MFHPSPRKCISGDSSGREEGKPSAVQVSCQVLPGGCVRGVDPGCHAATLLPAGEGGNPQRRHLLPPRNSRPSRLLRRAGQVCRLQQGGAHVWLPVQRTTAPPEVKPGSVLGEDP